MFKKRNQCKIMLQVQFKMYNYMSKVTVLSLECPVLTKNAQKLHPRALRFCYFPTKCYSPSIVLSDRQNRIQASNEKFGQLFMSCQLLTATWYCRIRTQGHSILSKFTVRQIDTSNSCHGKGIPTLQPFHTYLIYNRMCITSEGNSRSVILYADDRVHKQSGIKQNATSMYSIQL